MPYTTINLGLSLTVPTSGTRNWGQQLTTGTWNKISEHSHSGGGDGNQIDSAGLADDSVTTAKIAPNVGFTQAALVTVTGLNQSVALNWNNGMTQVIDVTNATGTLTISLANPQPGASYRLFFKQPATALTVTWPASVKWPQGQAPIWTGTLNAIDGVTLYYNAVDAVYWGDWQLNYS